MSLTDSPTSPFPSVSPDDFVREEDDLLQQEDDEMLSEESELSSRAVTPSTHNGDEEEDGFESVADPLIDPINVELIPTSSDIFKVVVDYLISEGNKEAAELLYEEAGIEPPKDELQSMDARVAIREAVLSGRVEESIQSIEALCPNLYNENQELRFHLMQQNLIEHIRNGETEKALEYAQEELGDSDAWTPEQLDRLEKTFALLAFEKPEASPFGKLMDLSQRQMVATEVNAAVLTALNKPPHSRLEVLFRMMTWSHHQYLVHSQSLENGEKPPDVLTIASNLFSSTTSV